MVERKVSKEKYLFAFLVTAAIFALGLMLGLVVEGKRSEYVQQNAADQGLSFSSLQLQYQLLDQFSDENNCQAVQATFEDNVRTLEQTRGRIEDYQQDSTLKSGDFERLQREYTLAQVRYWQLAEQTKDICGAEFSTILYFFDEVEDCPQCDEQSFVLTYLKQKMGQNILNFAFDGEELNEPLVPLLKNIYGVNEYPSLIINGEAYSGFTDINTILEEICPTYQNTTLDLCEGRDEVEVGQEATQQEEEQDTDSENQVEHEAISS